eukprot:CAMPEP_0168592582 /NCGR_PEP_ID=MMETSP0420-20121227/7817_1 /TAXON_ID=498008 /ORGANISM="Pessonella sp." /LENGTH=108 /DNA_ID=CAMNT_0008628595 /DNA_START=47 /DNA_END=370 /DNA_ORIENTATION=+
MANRDKLIGKFDYVKPGSLEQYTQEIDIRADGTASYFEKIETKTDTVTRTGDGTWTYSPQENDNEVLIRLKQLKKVTKMKQKSIIPGYGDSEKIDPDVIIDIKPKQLI